MIVSREITNLSFVFILDYESQFCSENLKKKRSQGSCNFIKVILLEQLLKLLFSKLRFSRHNFKNYFEFLSCLQFCLYVGPDGKLASFIIYNHNFLEFRLASQTMKAFKIKI